MLTAVSAEMLTQTVAAVFLNMMDLEVERCDTPWVADTQRLTASVHLAGDWSGALLFECSHRQACLFAGRFLGTEPPASVDGDVRDVLGELANMIGGNVKFAVAKGLTLALPSVTDGSDDGLRLCRSELQDRISFQCEHGLFWVTLLALRTDNHSPQTHWEPQADRSLA